MGGSPQVKKNELFLYVLVLASFALCSEGEAKKAGKCKPQRPHIVKGKKHGIEVTCYTNGNMYLSQRWVGGKQEGEYIQWYKNGRKAVKSTYKNGVYEGRFTSWHSNGQKSWEAMWVNGKAEGKTTWWYLNGKVRIKGQYRKSKQCGVWVRFTPTGKRLRFSSIYLPDDCKVYEEKAKCPPCKSSKSKSPTTRTFKK